WSMAPSARWPPDPAVCRSGRWSASDPVPEETDMSVSDEDWLRANQALLDRLASLKRDPARHAGDAAIAADTAPATAEPDVEAATGPSSALARLTTAFGL